MANTIYEIDVNNLPSNVSITMTPQLEALVQDAEYEAPVRKKPSVMQRIAAGALIALMAVIPYVAGCSNGNGNGDAINPIPSSYSVSENITPANGSGVGPDDDPLEIGVDTPALAAECSADPDCAAEAASGLDVVIEATYDNGTPGNPGDDETVSVASHTGVPFGSYTSGDLDLSAAHGGAGLADGEGIAAHVALTFTDSKGESHTIEGRVNYTYEGGPTGPRVTGCNVAGSNVGTSLAIDCICSETAESWGLTGGPDGVIITPSGTIGTGIVLEASDVGLHTYSVTCTAGGVTSVAYVFTVPVDEHESHLINNCYDLLLPETTVDAVASACGTGFNPLNKPDTNADPDYGLDLDHTCVLGAVAALSADERAAQENYNNGMTVPEAYSTCTVTHAEVLYHSDN